jgi:hypothetical protein
MPTVVTPWRVNNLCVCCGCSSHAMQAMMFVLLVVLPRDMDDKFVC